MPERDPIETTNLDMYGNEALPWSRPRDLLAVDPASTENQGGERLSYLSTVRPDCRPHSAGVGAMWHDGDMYIVSGPETRKSRNLAGWPCAVEGDAITAPYSAPSAGPPPWYLYRIRVHTAFGVATAEPSGATRWRFPG